MRGEVEELAPSAKEPRLSWRVVPRRGIGSMRIVERNGLASRRLWPVFAAGFVEPVLFLLSLGVGVGALVGGLPFHGHIVSYGRFVAPALLSVSAMNGAVYDTTFNFFVKFKYAHTYDAMLATPLGAGDVASGEVAWALLRGTVYAAVFLAVMAVAGDVTSWWALLAVPGAMVLGFGFAGAGLAATTWMRSFTDFDFVNLVLIPSFLFSSTFFPISQYPAAVGTVVRLTPLYQGVALERALCLGQPSWSLVLHAAYLAIMGATGLLVASRRLALLLQP